MFTEFLTLVMNKRPTVLKLMRVELYTHNEGRFVLAQ